MNKKAKFAIWGAVILGVGNGIVNVIKQSNSDDKFSWGKLLLALGKGAATGAAGGLIIGALADHQNSLVEPIDTDSILLALASEVKLNPKDHRYIQLSEKADWLINILKAELNYELKDKPHRFGSTENGTALKDKFDIDICLPLKSDAFSSTEQMFYNVDEILRKYIGHNSVVGVRNQKKSIGVFFKIGTDEYKIDVLPNKITRKRGNKSSGYLYVNNDGLFEKPTYTKTDVSLLKNARITETQKKILVLLKEWKTSKNLPVSSHLLQNLILDAYSMNYRKIPRRFTDKVLMVLEHIAANINSIVISSKENTNNILTNIPQSAKDEIASACCKLIEEFNYQPNSIVKIIQ